MLKNIRKFTVFSLIMVSTLLYSNEQILKGDNMVNYQANLTLKSANELIKIAKKIAEEKNLNLSIAIVDSSANLIAFSKMDNASLVTIDVAIQKARTAALIKAPSKFFEDKINKGEVSMLNVPNLTSLQGGIPIKCENQICGAIGVSGASGDIDNEIATETAMLFVSK